jgi:hypothetical protein
MREVQVLQHDGSCQWRSSVCFDVKIRGRNVVIFFYPGKIVQEIMSDSAEDALNRKGTGLQITTRDSFPANKIKLMHIHKDEAMSFTAIFASLPRPKQIQHARDSNNKQRGCLLDHWLESSPPVFNFWWLHRACPI